MAKNKEKLNTINEEAETLSKKQSAFTDEELEQVSGGEAENSCPKELEKTDPRYCIDRGVNYLCPFAKYNGYAYVCSLGKGTFLLPGYVYS